MSDGVPLNQFTALLAAVQAWEQRLRPDAGIPTVADLPRILAEIGEASAKTLAVLTGGEGNR